MPPSEKASSSPQPSTNMSMSTMNTSTSTPQDLPPSYETTISAPSTSTSIPNTPSHHPPSPAITIPSQNPLEALPRLAAINLSKYCVPESKLSDDSTTVTTTKPELATTQYALVKFIREQAYLPPKPLMIIRGTHERGSSGSFGDDGIVDFELKINLTSLLDIASTNYPDGGYANGSSSSSPSSSWSGPSTSDRRIRVQPVDQSLSPSTTPKQTSTITTRTGSGSNIRGGHGRGGGRSPQQRDSSTNSLNPNLTPLEQWIKRFCEDKTENRSFTIHRRPTPTFTTTTQILEGMVRTLLASTKYRGKVTVEFVFHYSAVTVLRRPPASSGTWVWLSNMVQNLLSRTKKYEVVESVWDVVGSTGTADTAGTTNTTGTERLSGTASLAAQDWWREWQPAIRNAVLARRQGWVTVEDWLEARMGVREKDRLMDWGTSGDY
ncbi:hypothetical protein HRR83_006356 [Exophiala dermatitidis]|uniref:Uncharacterized protein n=2 Tax=Exophiala dermatitidis TaxID=5970 RepID=H6CA31_EXODN|nr:uncharacterized protein HMPREF1120_07970 [Exophiala dermatitidis NIH/UT8656]KAJ4507370.1 hypothetical protein HRR75_006719 [Exophiala dermatitidis]EHY59995.1 hypothetical protein HMPREF1120_07970 [Exophiala dermatitidis NIH/UT8656]KAJ4509360.1 hypothetical protein HRR73_007214 [Exophiala dermatitidis]KAJ4509547.1 hypothetical protein HRR74_007328 [Exophiala dermatitidis]KAJ4530548.1 hypothetical protein HRR76_008256 [Exophiala dermatitidis]